jgi:CARDB protein
MARVPRSLALAAALVAGAATCRATRADEPLCNRWDLEVVCTATPMKVTVGQEFSATATVKNTGDTALANVTLQLRGDQGAPCVSGPGPVLRLVIEKLEPGDSKQVSGRFLPESMGNARILGSARDSLGWAAANCACTVQVLGLPALHSDMTDKDLAGAEKGVFAVGESFLYVLDVTNDQGTEVTPDLKVTFSLPKELEFVSATANGGVKVTGAGQSASTNVFVLAPPNGKLHVEFTVKVVGKPPGELVKARASIQTATGVELSGETESTTVK